MAAPIFTYILTSVSAAISGSSLGSSITALQINLANRAIDDWKRDCDILSTSIKELIKSLEDDYQDDTLSYKNNHRIAQQKFNRGMRDRRGDRERTKDAYALYFDDLVEVNNAVYYKWSQYAKNLPSIPPSPNYLNPTAAAAEPLSNYSSSLTEEHGSDTIPVQAAPPSRYRRLPGGEIELPWRTPRQAHEQEPVVASEVSIAELPSTNFRERNEPRQVEAWRNEGGDGQSEASRRRPAKVYARDFQRSRRPLVPGYPLPGTPERG